MTSAKMERVGQYVLGLLEGEALAQFERDMVFDPDVAAAVARLQAHMHTLDNPAPIAPSPDVWSRIEQRISEADAPTPDNVVTLASLPKRSWQWTAMAASVIVALGVGYFAGSLGSSQRQPVMIAVLINEADATPGAIVEAFADNSVRLVPLEQFDIPEGRILQVWTLPDPETGPVSLGTFDDPATIRLTGPDLPAPHAGQLYEITLEPAPGSPTGRPTGPILVKGFARAPV